MKVIVVFDFPEIESIEDGNRAIDSLKNDLTIMSNTTLYQWYIEKVLSDNKFLSTEPINLSVS
jgi:hypothetical protein